MKAILIDVNSRSVSEIDIPSTGTLYEWYKAIKCELVTVACYLDGHDSIIVDDEGLLTLDDDTMFFTFDGAPQPYAGNGLIVGTDKEGESVGCNITADEASLKIKFYTLQEIKKLLITKGI